MPCDLDTLNKSVGEGLIFYQSGEVDSFDKEDPDGDLDIWYHVTGFAQAWKVLEFRGLSWKVLEN